MKVLFVGEGPHDVGRSTDGRDTFLATGVVPTLARKVVTGIQGDSLAIHWSRIPRFPTDRGSGYAAKSKAAELLADKHGCKGLVLVADNDGKSMGDRLEKLRSAKNELRLPAACGVAVESVEAWTLGDPSALAQVLGVSEARLLECYAIKKVEMYKESSQKDEYQPKRILQSVAELGHRKDSTEFRSEVAEHASVEKLEMTCPKGFAPFAAELRAAFECPPCAITVK